MSEGADRTPGASTDQRGGAAAHGAAPGPDAGPEQDAAPVPTAPESTAPESTAPESTAPESTAPESTAPESTAPEYSAHPVAFRRPDVLASLLLVLAGVAAGISLLVPWLSDRDDSGMELVGRGFDEMGELGASGFWQPLAVVLGGGLLLVLGLLVLVPARTHHFLGALALLVSAIAAAGVLVPLAQDDWRFGGFAAGFWFAVAVPVLGLLGSLKALVSGPTYGTHAPAHRAGG
jgi:hypothetical protein